MGHQAYTVEQGILVPLPQPTARCWINLQRPERPELEALAKQFDLPIEFLEAALDPDERARYEVEDDCHLIVLRTPVKNFNGASDVPYSTRPLALVIKDHLIITVTNGENPVIQDFLEQRIKNLNTERVTRFVLQVLFRTALRYLRFLRDINSQTLLLERELQAAQRNEDLLQLLSYDKSLVYFNSSLRSNQLMLERFKRTGFYTKALEDEQDLLDDILIDTTQAIEMANIYSNNLSGLMNAFASVINNNLNVVMKRLTQITVILMLPTLVASLYGMNVALPFASNDYAFAIVMGITLLSIAAGLLFFSNRRF